MTLRDLRGQSLVEAAAVLPLILVIFAGLYVACRTGFRASAAQSAAQAEAIRSGRGLPGIERQLAADLLPGDNGALVGHDGGRGARLLPSPFPSLTGRTSGVVTVRKDWTETGAVGEFSPLSLARRSELDVDCWGANSGSGKKIRGIVRARVALGVIQ